MQPKPQLQPYRYVCTEGIVVYHLTVHPPSQDSFVYVYVVGSRDVGTVQCTWTQIVGWPSRAPQALRAHVLEALALAGRTWRA